MSRRGDVLTKLGKYDDATADYKKALEINPENGSAVVGLARIQY